MIIDGYEITTFTNLSKEVCLKVLNIVQKEFGEIGDFLIEDDEIGFRVYGGYFENAPKIIIEKGLKLKLIEKNNYHFALGYKILLKMEKIFLYRHQIFVNRNSIGFLHTQE